MRDISAKFDTLRVATARATLELHPETLERVTRGDIPKGAPLPVARVAAVQAAKNTSQIIPYCHPLPVDHVAVEFAPRERAIDIDVTVKAIYRTGVEMEALTAAAVAALTIYDMTKMLDDDMRITSVALLEKRGGKSDHAAASGAGRRAAVLVVSDSVAAGRAEDRSGRALAAGLAAAGFEVVRCDVCADEPADIEARLIGYADSEGLDVVVTTGGTGLGPRDHTPEVTAGVVQRDLDSLTEALRADGQRRMPFAMLSRGRAGVRGQTLIVNLPGSLRAVEEALPLLGTALPHALRMIDGGRHDAAG